MLNAIAKYSIYYLVINYSMGNITVSTMAISYFKTITEYMLTEALKSLALAYDDLF